MQRQRTIQNNIPQHARINGLHAMHNKHTFQGGRLKNENNTNTPRRQTIPTSKKNQRS